MVDSLRLLEILKKEMEGDRNARVDGLAGGAAKDFPEYRRITGEIAGLNVAISRIIDFHERLQQNES